MSLVARNHTVDPFADPKHDINNPLRYIPSNTLTTVGVVAFGGVSLALAIRMWTARWRTRYMLSIVIGAFAMTAGLAMRYALTHNPDSIGLYIIEDLLVVLSPCAFIAANYTLLGRLARHTRTGEYIFIRPARVTLFFLSSDICTFLLQGNGGSLSISHTASVRTLGGILFKVGMIGQLISFIAFTVMFLVWLWWVRSEAPDRWESSRREKADGTPTGKYHWYNDWRALAGALGVSCIGIIIRSVYRTIEALQGYTGALATNEHTFYGLDSAPLWMAIAVYAIFWPGSFINFDRISQPVEEENELQALERQAEGEALAPVTV